MPKDKMDDIAHRENGDEGGKGKMKELNLWIDSLTLSENHAYGQRKYGKGRYLKPEAVKWIAETKLSLERQIEEWKFLKGFNGILPTLEDAKKGIGICCHLYYADLRKRDCHNQKLLYDVISEVIGIDDQYFIPNPGWRITIGESDGINVKISWGEEIRHLSPECQKRENKLKRRKTRD